MALHKDFPKDKFQILDPAIRWFPAEEDLREKGYEKLLPPFVPELREIVAKWREDNYEGASETSKALLNWWFKEPHAILLKMTPASLFNITMPKEKQQKLLFGCMMLKSREQI